MVNKMRLTFFLGKLICESVCSHSTLHLIDQFAKGKDIEKTLDVFVLFCFNHIINLV